jgi:hypothetical protein
MVRRSNRRRAKKTSRRDRGARRQIHGFTQIQQIQDIHDPRPPNHGCPNTAPVPAPHRCTGTRTPRARAHGCNAATGQYGDKVELGILDPTKVTRTALQNAASIAGLMSTTGAMVAEAPKKDSAGRWPWRP